MDDFTPYGKTPRFFREVTITEKVDGSNGGILIQKYDDLAHAGIDEDIDAGRAVFVEPRPVEGSSWTYVVRAQSRKRFVWPGQDNFAFGLWVHEHAAELVEDLGEGLHFGEWCGKGIQRGYGLDERYFLLFNPARYGQKMWGIAGSYAEHRRAFTTPNLGVVPLLSTEFLSTESINDWTSYVGGSSLVPAYATGEDTMGVRGEGVIVFHSQSRQVYKVLAENDDLSKTEAGLS